MRRPDPYPLMRQFARPVLSHTSFWRVLLVLVGFEVAFEYTPAIFDPDGFGPVRPIDTVIELAAFAIPCAVLVILVRLMHRRGFASLTGPLAQVWPVLWRSFAWVAVVLAIQEPIYLMEEMQYIETTRPLLQWAVMIPFGMAALLIQTGTEEILYRGYMQQELAARVRSPWVWMVLPSVLFGLAHYGNGGSHNEGLLWAFWAMLLGLACADLTARVGHIGPAVGLHLANNCFALFVSATTDWPASGLALFLHPMPPPSVAAGDPYQITLLDPVFSVLGIAVMWLAARVAIRA